MRIDRNVPRGVKSIRVGTTVVPIPDPGGYNIKMIYPPGKPRPLGGELHFFSNPMALFNAKFLFAQPPRVRTLKGRLYELDDGDTTAPSHSLSKSKMFDPPVVLQIFADGIP